MSQSGNTKKIAEAIFETISGEKEIKPLNEVESLDNYGFTFIGFPIHQMGPPHIASTFIETKAKNKKVALFVTHASPPGTPFIDPLLTRCKESANDSEMFGIYNCQGVLAQQVADMLLKMDNPQAQQFGKMQDTTVGHPDEQEVEKARNFAREIMENL